MATLEIHGDGGCLPTEPDRNTAGVAAQAVLDTLRQRGVADPGVRLVLEKGMPISSGLGSSAASSVAAAVAVDRLFGSSLTREELLSCALEGELVATGSLHADNVAPCLYGGFVLARAVTPEPDIVELPVPKGLSCAVVRPHMEIETRASRERLGDQVQLVDGVRQWANTAALTAALYSGDLDLLSRSLEDAIAEPKRADLVPGFFEAKSAALEAGALGSSLSGSGPSIFAVCRDRRSAETVVRAMLDALRDAVALDCDPLVTAVGAPGARQVEAT